MQFDFSGKVAIVTGSGQGIGEAIALAFAKAGADVVIADMNEQAANRVADRIKSLGRQALAVRADVSNGESVSRLVEKTLDKFKKIDILVNNAGIAKVIPSAEMSVADWDSILDINLKGQFLCSQAVGRQMIKQKRGKIINIASTAGHRGFLGLAAYSASKGGVLSLTRQLAVEWAEYNINVNSVSPSTTLTTMVKKYFEDTGIDMKDQSKRVPLGRLNEPEDIATAVLFLASPEADNITGQDILVDGGVSALFWPVGQY